ncbi:hypothetical protein Tco_0441584 [Tanacetum coccineum]
MKETLYEFLENDQKKKLGKNNEAKINLYNALLRKEYERVFMCKTTKEVWHTLIITHQGNSQVKNTRCSQSSMKKLLIAALHDSTLLTKVTAIKEAKDLATLALDELIRNLKIFEMVVDKDGVGSKTTKEKVKPLALKANITRGQTNNNSTCQDESNNDEEIDLMAKNIGKLSRIGVNVHHKFDICKVKTKGGESSRRERECYN